MAIFHAIFSPHFGVTQIEKKKKKDSKVTRPRMNMSWNVPVAVSFDPL